LEEQNRTFGAGARTLENIAHLRDTDSYAVVTGQQVGLFTGPAFTIYKALTAIKLATHYACRGIKAVPVFWMATEDHDLAEVDHSTVLDNDSVLQTVRFEVGEESQHRPAGKVTFNSSITEVCRQFVDVLPNSEFRQEIAQGLEKAYQPGKTFGRSFAETLSNLFSNYGLILLDPLDDRVKQLLRPLLLKVLDKESSYYSLLEARNHQLIDKGYHVQVETDSEATPLFVEESGGRRALTREDHRFKLKGSDHSFGPEELYSYLSANPGLISLNVLLRPVGQDFLLPTMAYVAGPSELAYLAQVSDFYVQLGVRMPIIFPRASISIVEKRISKVLDKYNLDFCELLRGPESVMRNIVEKQLDQSLAGEFSQIEKDFQLRLSKLGPSLGKVDLTLVEALGTAQRKIQYHIDHLRTKLINAEAKHQETLTRQVEKTLAILQPSKSLQEREINIFYFLSRYGMDLLAQLYEEIDLTDPDHRLIYV
jgi:bacillithiol biosynthesis cysteine-adding enzyme BshC